MASLQTLSPQLHVRVCEARDLYNPQLFGRPDPYCIVMHNLKRYDTTPQRSTVTPVFNTVFHFDADPQELLTIEIWNRNLGVSDELLGCCYVGLSCLPRGVVLDDWIPLRHCRNRPSAVRLRLLAEGFGVEGAAMPRQQEEVVVMRGLQTDDPAAYLMPPGTLLQFQMPEPVVGTVMVHSPSLDGGAFRGTGFVAQGVDGSRHATAPPMEVVGAVVAEDSHTSSSSSSQRARRPKSPKTCA